MSDEEAMALEARLEQVQENSSSSSWLPSMSTVGMALGGMVAAGALAAGAAWLISEHGDDIRELCVDGLENTVNALQGGVEYVGPQARDAAITLWNGAQRAAEVGKPALESALREAFNEMRSRAGDLAGELEAAGYI